MSKFVKTLSASNGEIKTLRAESLAEEVKLEVETFLNNLKRESIQLKNKLTKLTDLAPDNKYSLRPGGDGFDAAAWIKELHQTKMDIALKEVELTQAEEIVKEWFTDED
jgi:hypothetical protein